MTSETGLGRGWAAKARPGPPAKARPGPPELPLDEIRSAVLAWYDAGSRSLPFRGATDAWAILVAETMAQQTQAERAGRSWASFMSQYPTPWALASAEPAEVVRAWRGLGYNRRALALRGAAQRIADEHGGRVPDDPWALEALPGVGPYTARAVAALAYGRRVGPVDTNVRRVLRRLVGRPLADRETQALADALVDPARPGDWVHALIDVGAGPCRPLAPACDSCPLGAWCRSAGANGEAAGAAAGDLRSDPRRRVKRGPGAAPRRPSRPFPSTSRWLRGRIVDRLRDAGGEGWMRVRAPIGEHDEAAIHRAVGGLIHDGLAERHPADPGRIRLPRRTAGCGAPGPTTARTLDAP